MPAISGGTSAAGTNKQAATAPGRPSSKAHRTKRKGK